MFVLFIGYVYLQMRRTSDLPVSVNYAAVSLSGDNICWGSAYNS